MKRFLLPLLLSLAGCVTTPDGGRELSDEGQAIMTTSARIAMRHFVADSPRSQERILHVRAVIAKLQSQVIPETTLGALKAVVVAEIERQNFDPVEKADYLDLLDLFGAALESRLGQEPLQATGVVRVRDFLNALVAAIPTLSV